MAVIEYYDVAVVGGGHAGLEAAVAAARLGVRVVLFTLSLDTVANLPCNPSIGGTAKGHLVREIDALGGCMALLADAALIQSRMLNTTKGPAVHSLRAQTDRAAYHTFAKKLLEGIGGLEIKQAEIVQILLNNNKAVGVKTALGAEYHCSSVVLATGTYLGGKIFVGEAAYSSGPDGVCAALQLSDSLKRIGISLMRFKTGTPARVHRRSICFKKLGVQKGDEPVIPFSFMTESLLQNRADCYIAYTNEATHRVIRQNLHRSPLYGGAIEGIGPRYCPSIEDKVVRFAEKDRHQIFVEPCGLNTEEYYLQGMSSSLPEDVQIEMYRTVTGFERLELMRPAYAIEYDCIDPLQLRASLCFIDIVGLFGAGQFNGTSGYEEAAAQGLIAGVNAARAAQGRPPVILPRHQSYIGTLIDDLVTKGVSDPYRMMTSRSEYRLTLRQDNADERLTPLGREIGLVDDARWAKYKKTEKCKKNELKRLDTTFVSPAAAAPLLEKMQASPLKSGASAADLLRRPELHYPDIALLVGRGEGIDDNLATRVETEIKYAGYIQRQHLQIEAVKRQEAKQIPAGFCYEGLSGLRLEAREKLARVRPESVGQAGRIPGVSPSDVAQLTLALALYRKNMTER